MLRHSGHWDHLFCHRLWQVSGHLRHLRSVPICFHRTRAHAPLITRSHKNTGLYASDNIHIFLFNAFNENVFQVLDPTKARRVPKLTRYREQTFSLNLKLLHPLQYFSPRGGHGACRWNQKGPCCEMIHWHLKSVTTGLAVGAKESIQVKCVLSHKGRARRRLPPDTFSLT